MRPLNLICFLLSSLLVFNACNPLKNYRFEGLKKVDEKVLMPVLDKNNAQRFKTTLDAGKHHFSGILILKQTSADTAHLTFVTEIGMKMFDFTIVHRELDLIYLFEPLNKPGLVSMIREDLQLLLLYEILGFEADHYSKQNLFIYRRHEIPKTYYFGSYNTVNKILVKKGISTKKKVNYISGPDGTLQEINLRHKSIITLKLKLSKLPVSEQ